MANQAKIRQAHRIIEDIIEGCEPTLNDMKILRSFLPEPPKQKTLQEIIANVGDAWAGAGGNDWGGNSYDSGVTLEDWLLELHAQLQGLQDQQTAADSSPEPAPGLPDGMRLATHPDYGLCVVAPTTDEDGERRIFYLSDGTETGADCRWVPVVHLTFLDEESAYPGFLQGKEDYQRAPDGTIVVYKKSVPFIKWVGNWQATMAGDKPTAAEMGTTRRRVLRWGYGNE